MAINQRVEKSLVEIKREGETAHNRCGQLREIAKTALIKRAERCRLGRPEIGVKMPPRHWGVIIRGIGNIDRADHQRFIEIARRVENPLAAGDTFLAMPDIAARDIHPWPRDPLFFALIEGEESARDRGDLGKHGL